MLYLDGIGISFLVKEIKEKILRYKLTKIFQYDRVSFSLFFGKNNLLFQVKDNSTILLEKEGYFFQKRVKMTLCHIEKFLSIYIVIFFPLFPLQEMKFQFHLNRAYFPPLWQGVKTSLLLQTLLFLNFVQFTFPIDYHYF